MIIDHDVAEMELQGRSEQFDLSKLNKLKKEIFQVVKMAESYKDDKVILEDQISEMCPNGGPYAIGYEIDDLSKMNIPTGDMFGTYVRSSETDGDKDKFVVSVTKDNKTSDISCSYSYSKEHEHDILFNAQDNVIPNAASEDKEYYFHLQKGETNFKLSSCMDN